MTKVSIKKDVVLTEHMIQQKDVSANLVFMELIVKKNTNKHVKPRILLVQEKEHARIILDVNVIKAMGGNHVN